MSDASVAHSGEDRELTDGFHLVIDALKLNGVKTIYNVPGIPITDLGRMAQAAGIRVISFRHEQHAGNAAAIAGYLTKQPGICLTVSAPGFLNGLTALANATTNCFPMILISGSSDICMLSGFGQVLAAVEKGGRLKVVAGAGVVPFQAMFTKRADIRTMKDLEGKTIGTGSLGALLHQTVVALLEKKGVDTKKVNFVNVGSSADVFRAVVAGTVDAGPGLYDVYDQQQKYGVHVPSDGEFWRELREYVYQGSYASDKAIAEKRDPLVRLLAAYAKLYRHISSPDSLDDYIRARQDALGGDAKQVAAEATSEWGFIQREQPYAKNLVLTEEQLRFMQELNMKTGSQTKILPFQQVADMSIALDAVKRLG